MVSSSLSLASFSLEGDIGSGDSGVDSSNLSEYDLLKDVDMNFHVPLP